MPPSAEVKENRVPAAEDHRLARDDNSSIVNNNIKSSGSTKYVLRADEYSRTTHVARILLTAIVALCVWYRNVIQVQIDNLWAYLREDQLFQSAHYETIYVTIVYAILMFSYPYIMLHIPYFQRFKVSKEVEYVNQTILGMGMDLIFHLTPLIIADMLIIKRYPGVSYSEVAARKQGWIVRTRPLPHDSPEFITLCLHVLGSVFLFDFFFTLVHYALHRNWFLYKYVHSLHHNHEIVHAHVTNQLSVVERGLQVISANYALKAFGCHPLTRLVFVPVFLWLLIENHTGVDLPWAPHRLCPGEIMGGPAKHHAHHTQGHGNYQPFFTYLDNWMMKRKDSKNKKHS